MKITYFKLENSAGILTGSDKNSIEIDFSNSSNKIISIQGCNGSGKSTLISALTPFSSVSSSIDERGSLSFIKEKLDGYKEIHYRDGEDNFIIKHFFKAQKQGGHSVKSYFSKNGKELNVNGNVTSFNDLVEIHFGLTPEMIRLLRLGSNVNSFINLPTAKRKEYIGRLIKELEKYISIYKKVGDDLKVLRVLISTNSSNIAKCNISNLDNEVKEILNLKKKLETTLKEKEKIFAKISKAKELKKDNSVTSLQNEIQQAVNFISEFNLIEKRFKEIKSPEKKSKEKDLLTEKIIELRSQLNSFRLQIDSNLTKINQLNLSVSKYLNSETIENLQEVIKKLKAKINSFTNYGFNFSSNEINYCISTLSSLNQLGRIFASFDNKSIATFIKLKKQNKSIQNFIKEQAKKNLLLNRIDFNLLIKELFKSDGIIAPSCESEFKSCPFYRISTLLENSEKDNEILSPESLKQIEILQNNFILIEAELSKFKSLNLDNKIKSQFSSKGILERISTREQLFSVDELTELLFLVKAQEANEQDKLKLKELEAKLTFCNENGVKQTQLQVTELTTQNSELKQKITELSKELQLTESNFTKIKTELEVIGEYSNRSKVIDQVKKNLTELKEKFLKIEKIENEIKALSLQYLSFENQVRELQELIKEKENKVETYKNLIEESKKLTKKFNELSMIHDSVSTKKGIPVIYIKSYLGQIYAFTNQLLKIIYEGELQIGEFVVSQDSFEIPFIKNGVLISDIKYGSQSEVALITMALSFALSKLAITKYNILLLDEIDAGLDDSNRFLFLKMLKSQIEQISAEQVFIISHNLANGMLNIPLDVIKLGETNFDSKLFNVIYK